METYADGDADGLLDCLAEGWVMHERDGSISTPEDLATVTRAHADAFREKEFGYVFEVFEVCEADQVAQFVRFRLKHTAPYGGIEATGRTVELAEMIFHRFDGNRLAESRRIVYPDSVRAALEG